MNFDPNTGEQINQTENNTNINLEGQPVQEPVVQEQIVQEPPVQIEPDPTEQLKKTPNKIVIAILTVAILTGAFICLVVGVRMYVGDTQEPNQDNKPVTPDCSIAYDCELYTKSEYICKYKDNNNEEKEMKCPWTEVKEGQYKKTQPTTTTTEAIKDPIVAIKDYNDVIKGKLSQSIVNDGVIVLDNNFQKMKEFYLYRNNPCSSDGEVKSFQDGQLKVDYKCKLIDDYENGYEMDVTVNDKFKFKETNTSTCGTQYHYFNNEYYIVLNTSCAINSGDLTVYNSNGTKVMSVDGFIYPTISIDGSKINSYGSEGENLAVVPYIKDNSLYYFAGKDLGGSEDYQNPKYEDMCYIKKYDFNTKKEITLNSFKCYYTEP